MKPRTAVKKISDKRLQSLGGVMPRSSIASKPKPIKKNAKRAAKRLARTHGPTVFREFTKQQPCKACGRLYHSENAHVLGNGGLGRKKDWTTVAPLCGDEFAHVGCHTLFDEFRAAFTRRFPDFDPATAVAEHQAAYQLYLREHPE